MNLAKKTYLSMAMSVAMAGIGAPAYVGAVTLSQDLIGDVGIVPYYTMRDGWTTDFNIVNTGNNTVAAKVRFHEGRNSREVLDFIVVLSPYDQINFYAVEDPSLGPVIRFPGTNSEKTCVVPIPNGRLPRADGVGGTLPFSAVDFRIPCGPSRMSMWSALQPGCMIRATAEIIHSEAMARFSGVSAAPR